MNESSILLSSLSFVAGVALAVSAMIILRKNIKKDIEATWQKTIVSINKDVQEACQASVKRANKSLEEAYQEGIIQGRLIETKNPTTLTIEYRPYVSEFVGKGLINHTVKIEIGYQYQALINDIPCFAPILNIEQRYEEKIVDEKKLQFYVETAVKMAENIAYVRRKSGRVATRLVEPIINKNR
jgi:hypothetical protein